MKGQARATVSKVPEITLAFWIIKIAATPPASARASGRVARFARCGGIYGAESNPSVSTYPQLFLDNSTRAIARVWSLQGHNFICR